MAAIQGIDIPVAEQLKFYDVWGSPMTTPHMSVAWSWAFDSPFKWTKQVASHFGGTRQGMAIAWPSGGIRTQFHHMIDIVPTILEATGIQAPTTADGIAQKPIEGVSLVYTWDKDNARAPSARTTQYFEMFGNRAIYRGRRAGACRRQHRVRLYLRRTWRCQGWDGHPEGGRP